ncbi:CgeB family protein [Cytobacillus massiliigabonensis]|uniref:CgeB family protein n=1 Tax=Cytobacillus massiliigabonensis TaxID=1871011 RepID=UPI000C85BE22|nr:glycosyltransferase [Cytobacillus massiliigabonensis]
MKILFISSGYNGIYDHFEAWIVQELSKKHEVRYFQNKNGLRSLQLLTTTFMPEAAITMVGFKLPVSMVQWLKANKIKTAIWFTEDPYFMDQTAELSRHYDFVFTIDTAALDFYRNNGHTHAYHLPLATEPDIFMPKEMVEKLKSDLCIVGYPYPDRVQSIQFLLQNTPYIIRVVGNWKKPLYYYQHNPKLIINEGWVKPSIAADFYNCAKITLNTHRPFNLKHNQNRLGIKGKSINNRTFDVAACEAFQLIEFKEDLPNHFVEDEEIAVFRSNDELLKKIDYYLQNDSERQSMAAKARNRVLKDHTFEKRLDKLIHIISNSTI